MTAEGFRSLYHNSGAFGFARGADVKYAGWVGPPDGSIRAEMRPLVRDVPPPYEANLARAARRGGGERCRALQPGQRRRPGVRGLGTDRVRAPRGPAARPPADERL